MPNAEWPAFAKTTAWQANGAGMRSQVQLGNEEWRPSVMGSRKWEDWS